MGFPYLLVVLLALPLVAAGLIVAVSIVRRHGRPAEPAHRFQADTAAVQDAAGGTSGVTRRIASGRERRAASAARLKQG